MTETERRRMTYHINEPALTVIAIDGAGESCDLNADGAPCASLDDLRGFVRELREQGAFDETIETRLLAEIEENIERVS